MKVIDLVKFEHSSQTISLSKKIKSFDILFQKVL